MTISFSQVVQVVMAGLLTAAIIANVQAYGVLSSLTTTIQYMQSNQVAMERRLERLEERRYE